MNLARLSVLLSPIALAAMGCAASSADEESETAPIVHFETALETKEPKLPPKPNGGGGTSSCGTCRASTSTGSDVCVLTAGWCDSERRLHCTYECSGVIGPD